MFPTTAGKRWFLLDVVVTFVLARTNSFFLSQTFLTQTFLHCGSNQSLRFGKRSHFGKGLSQTLGI
jgi:hypothetical protein